MKKVNKVVVHTMLKKKLFAPFIQLKQNATSVTSWMWHNDIGMLSDLSMFDVFRFSMPSLQLPV